MRREYTGIRKMQWDMLWHALFDTIGGKESWDRVSREEAMRILKKIETKRASQPGRDAAPNQ